MLVGAEFVRLCSDQLCFGGGPLILVSGSLAAVCQICGAAGSSERNEGDGYSGGLEPLTVL